MEEPQVGDHWTYEFRDEISGSLKSTFTATVTDVSPAVIAIKVAVLGKSDFGYQTFDRAWNVLESGFWRYAPNDGTGIQAPLAVGKSWSFKSTDVNRNAGVSEKRSGSAKVTAKETITTSAGTFETFKIETSVATQNANNPTRKFQSKQQTWFATEINHWVKRTFILRSEGKVRERNTTELIEYGRR